MWTSKSGIDIKKTLIMGLAFGTISVAWSVYNAFVPVFLSGLALSTTAIGFIMTFDNIFGLLLQPYFGKLSDRTKTKVGRRMPFILVGVPLASVGMVLIPEGAAMGAESFALGDGLIASLVPLMACIILMNLSMSIYRAPTVALMPDATPAKLRSEANGIINLMGGLGSAIAFLIGGKLFDIDPRYPFWLAAFLMVAILALLLAKYREPQVPFEADDSEVEVGGVVEKKKNKSLLPLLIAVFFWFSAYTGVETFYTLYAMDKFGMTAGDAATMLLFLSGSYLAFAYPAGKVGAKIGRKRTMLIGTAMIVLVTMTQAVFASITLMPVLLVTAGCAVAMININSYPAVVQMAGRGESGKYTGYYYAFSFSASIASPLLYGLIADFAGSNSVLFTYVCGMYAISALFVMLVKSKEIEIANL